MSDSAADTIEEVPPKSGGKGLIVGAIAALVLAGVGFYVTYSGLLGGNPTDAEPEADGHETLSPRIAFVALDPLVVSLGNNARSRHLRFGAQLEVPTEYEAEVRHLMPRVLDILNAYLRAIDSRDIEDPASLIRLRAHMLRRVQTVTGEGRVRDLLITEFVLN